MVKKTVVQYTLESCVNCMKCVRICPASALSLVDNRINIDDNRCINCMRCVKNCPAECRHVPKERLRAMTEQLRVACDSRKENAFFG